MSAPKPSFIAKMDRAEHHINDLEHVIAGYSARHPYKVSVSRENKKQVYRLVFTERPPDEISVIAADIVHNLSSGLDHLAAALVPSSRRDSTMFPIFFEGVWEPSVPGENPETTEARLRWNSCVKKMHPEAVAILKGLQRNYVAEDRSQHPTLVAIRRLSNTDKHSQFPLVLQGLQHCTGSYRRQGSVITQTIRDPFYLVKDNTTLKGVPDDAVNVQIKGTPLVTIRVSPPAWNIPIPVALKGSLQWLRETVIPSLTPFLHVSGGHRPSLGSTAKG